MPNYSKFACLGALATLAGLTPGHAYSSNDHFDNRFYLAPMAIYQVADGDRASDNGIGLSFGVGRNLADNFALELSTFYIESDAESSSGSFDLSGAEISALVFPRKRLPNLFGTVGAGFQKGSDHPGTPSDYDSAVFHAGVGYLFRIGFLTEGSALRAEAKFSLDSHSERSLGDGGRKEFYDSLLGLGLYIPLGAAPLPPPPPPVEPVKLAPVVAPADTDGDGVIDDLDQCPGTPTGTAVDTVGCAVPPPPPPQPPPSTCRAPIAGQPIDLKGCGTGDIIVLRGVNFEYDRSRLTANAKVVLDFVVKGLMQVPDSPVELGGHTDSRGTDSYNQTLSEKRAQSVRAYLIDKGVPPAQLSARGYGETRPVADNDIDEGRELNRRVELMFTE